MASVKKVKVYKYKNIAAALAIFLLTAVAISTTGNSDDNESSGKQTNNSDISVSSKDTVSSASDSSQAEFKAGKLTKNYEYQSIKNGEQLNNGKLVLINSKHPFTGTASDTDGVYPYLFDDSGNQIMYATSTLIDGNSEMLEKFQRLGIDFYQKKKLSTLMISKLIPVSDEENTSSSADKADENQSGYCVDLHLYDSASGTYPEFTGEGEYSWIAENCWKYGFILRYPADKSEITGNAGLVNHFRYVGTLYSELMQSEGLCLEEFIDFVKPYTFENPLSFKTFDDCGYAIYYVEADLKNTTTNIPLPLTQDNVRYDYDISGNNVDGYIVSVNLSKVNAEKETKVVSDDASSADEASADNRTEE